MCAHIYVDLLYGLVINTPSVICKVTCLPTLIFLKVFIRMGCVCFVICVSVRSYSWASMLYYVCKKNLKINILPFKVYIHINMFLNTRLKVWSSLIHEKKTKNARHNCFSTKWSRSLIKNQHIFDDKGKQTLM